MSEDNLPANRDNISLPSAPDAKPFGVEMGQEDLVMPRLTLVQPTSKIDGAGKFHYSLTGELFERFDAVVFSNQRGRVMFDPDMSKQEVICGSDNRVDVAKRFTEPQAANCLDCSFSKRGYSEEVIIGGKKVEKYCAETQALKCMFVDTLLPFVFIGRRTSLMPINEFLTYMQYETVKYKKPLCCFPIRVTSAVVAKANQKYYVPRIERLGMIEREEFIAMMNKYANYDVGATLDEEMKAESGETVPF